jgi:hypothetical protein
LRWSRLRRTDRVEREWLSSPETVLTAKEGLLRARVVSYADGVSDDRTYRLIRRKPGGTGSENVIRDAFAAKDDRVTERDLPVVVVPAGTQPDVPRLNPAPRPPDLVDKRRFGGVELTIEYRGDEITIVVPGVVRLTGSRTDALAMIEALARTPRPA